MTTIMSNIQHLRVNVCYTQILWITLKAIQSLFTNKTNYGLPFCNLAMKK